MTVHIDISKSKATLAEVVDIIETGQTVILDRAGASVGAVTALPTAQPVSLVERNASLFGAWAHLGPFSDEFLDSFLEPDSDFDPDKSLFPE